VSVSPAAIVARRENDEGVLRVHIAGDTLHAGRRRGIEAERALQQRRDGVVLAHRDGIDAVVVGRAGRSRAAGPAAVHERLGDLGPGLNVDVEQAVVDDHVDAFGGDHRGRAVDAHGARLFDARADQGDETALGRRGDLRALRDGDGRGAADQAAQLDPAVRPEEGAVRVAHRIEAGEQQAADIEHGGGRDEDPARGIESDSAARSGDIAGGIAQLADHASVEVDPA
jgi:hypothetical protein